jgi:hypothetical protein
MTIIHKERVDFLHWCKGIALVIVSLLIPFLSAEAQLKLQQLPRSANAKTINNARTNADPIQLPFFDDFSVTPLIDGVNATGGVPLESHWEVSSRSAYVNPGNGINPPSINVATLDGLNRLGERYSEQQLNNGFADTLVSQPIDLGILSVPLPDRDSVYLSFFYQRGGFVEIPDAKDYLLLEFKNNEGAWEKIQEFHPVDAPNRDEFYIAVIKIVGDAFFHSEFQFRIRNFGRLSGPFDSWNIDHVYLDIREKKYDDPMDLAELTFTRYVSPLFGRYHSMPLEHFRDSSHLEPLHSGAYSLWKTFSPTASYEVIARFNNVMEDGSVVSSSVPFTDDARGVRPGEGENTILNQFEHITFTLDTLADPTNPAQFNPAAKRIDIEYQFSLVSEPGTRVQPEYFKANDTIRSTYHLDDYYAYDDGSAEYAAILTNPGVRVAYAFDLIRKSDEPEFINGFDVYFPKWGVTPNLFPAFHIYDDNNGEPGEILWAISSLPISQNEQNQFQFVPIYESVQVNKRFYIGWEAPVGGLVAVGIDYNNNTADKILYRANGVWNVNDGILGSLMIRPHMGEGIVSGIPEDTKVSRAYPNPNQGTFYIDDEVKILDVLSVSGQQIPATYRWENNQTRIFLNEPAPGMYILRTLKGNHIQTQKVVVTASF